MFSVYVTKQNLRHCREGGGQWKKDVAESTFACQKSGCWTQHWQTHTWTNQSKNKQKCVLDFSATTFNRILSKPHMAPLAPTEPCIVVIYYHLFCLKACKSATVSVANLFVFLYILCIKSWNRVLEFSASFLLPFTTLWNFLLQSTKEVANELQEHSNGAAYSEIMLQHNITGNGMIPPTTASICPVKTFKGYRTRNKAKTMNDEREEIPRTPHLDMYERKC